MPNKSNSFKRVNKEASKRKVTESREINKITTKSSELLEEISSEISPEQVQKIENDIEESNSKIEKASKILAGDSDFTGNDQVDNKEKIRREMEKLKEKIRREMEKLKEEIER